MIEEIIGTISRYAGEKVKLSKGMIFLITVAAFIAGLASGAVAVKLAMSKKIAAGSSCGEVFDADEYVRNLNFDYEDE